MELDIRKLTTDSVEVIRFADKLGKVRTNTNVAQKIQKYTGSGAIKIMDSSEYVVVESVSHARHLIAALEKAIELEWLTSK